MLQAPWEREAAANHVFPLDDRNIDRLPHTYYLSPRRRWSFAQGQGRLSGYAAPAIGNRSYLIEGEIEIDLASHGVILAAGGQAGGFVLHLDGGHLVHEYVGPRARRCCAAPRRWSRGRRRIAFQFAKTGDCRGTASLLVDGRTEAVAAMADLGPHRSAAG